MARGHLGSLGRKSGAGQGGKSGAVWERFGSARERKGSGKGALLALQKVAPARARAREAQRLRPIRSKLLDKRVRPRLLSSPSRCFSTLARGEPGRGRRVSTTPHSPHGRNNNQGRSQNEPRRFCVVWQRKAPPIWSVQPRQTREILTHSGRPILGQFRDSSRVCG